MSGIRRLKRQVKRNVVEAVPQPAGSINLATLLRVRKATPDADFCHCDPALGEHLSTTSEPANGQVAVIHFFPGASDTTVLSITTRAADE